MSFLVFLLFGLIAGAIAKMIMPGAQGGGWVSSLIIGCLGAILGGWLGGLLFNVDLLKGFFNISSWIAAIVGACICLAIWGWIQGRSSRV